MQSAASHQWGVPPHHYCGMDEWLQREALMELVPVGVGLAQECLACDECTFCTIRISPRSKFSLHWSLPTPTTTTAVFFPSSELCKLCWVGFKALHTSCSAMQLEAPGVVMHCLVLGKGQRAGVLPRGSGSFGCYTIL